MSVKLQLEKEKENSIKMFLQFLKSNPCDIETAIDFCESHSINEDIPLESHTKGLLELNCSITTKGKKWCNQ